MAVLILVALCLLGGFFGADSRPLDTVRPTRWVWPPEQR